MGFPESTVAILPLPKPILLAHPKASLLWNSPPPPPPPYTLNTLSSRCMGMRVFEHCSTIMYRRVEKGEKKVCVGGENLGHGETVQSFPSWKLYPCACLKTIGQRRNSERKKICFWINPQARRLVSERKHCQTLPSKAASH